MMSGHLRDELVLLLVGDVASFKAFAKPSDCFVDLLRPRRFRFQKVAMRLLQASMNGK